MNPSIVSPPQGMVGLFTDWRDLTISTPSELSLLALLLQLADLLRLRRWKIFNPLRCLGGVSLSGWMFFSVFVCRKKGSWLQVLSRVLGIQRYFFLRF